MNTIEVCLAPKLFNNYSIDNKIVVVVDILRATTIITTMFQNGLSKLIPVKNLYEAQNYQKKGFLIAAERNGKKVDFADFDNSPYTFTTDAIKGKTLVYSTTNGTNTINLVKDAERVVLASFLNLKAITDYISKQNKDILILCSGWKGNYCIEDALFAGSLTEQLLEKQFVYEDDSVLTSLEIWHTAKKDLLHYIKNIYQYERLVKLGLEGIINYCFQTDISDVIPALQQDYVIDLKKIT